MVGNLLRERGAVGTADNKTVKIHRFEVGPDVEALTLAFDYGPRVATDRAKNLPLVEAAFELHTRRRRAVLAPDAIAKHRAALNVDARAEGLANLMNVVLIDQQGRWRGRWDRNPSSDAGALVLARDHASRGFLPGAIEPGTWTCAIECHGLFQDGISYEVSVEAIADPGRRPTAPARSGPWGPGVSRRTGPGWYFGEMHSHTVHSDGKWEVAGLADKAAGTGADFLCLTDHNTISGHLEETNDTLPLTLVSGMELTTFHGHHPIYGIDAMIPWHEDGRVLGLDETGKRARAMGGLVGVAHPFVPGDPLCTGCRMIDTLDPRTFDMMEVWYRRWDSPGADNEAAYALWNEHWRNGHPITAVAARDWHGPDQDGPFPGPLPFTGVYAADNTPGGILEGLRSGRVIMSGGPVLDVSLREGTRVVPMGGASAMGAPSLHVEASRLDGPAELRVFRAGVPFHVVPVEGPSLDLSLPAPAPGHYRAELWTHGDPQRPLAITNHVVWTA